MFVNFKVNCGKIIIFIWIERVTKIIV